MGIRCFNPDGTKADVGRFYLTSHDETVHIISCGACFCIKCTNGWSYRGKVEDSSESAFDKAHDIAIKKFGNLSELYPWIASPIKQWLVEGKPTEEVYLVG